MTTITRIIALEHAASEEVARTGDALVNAQMLVRNSAVSIDAPTAADRESDAKMEAWKARQREESRKIICARLAAEQRQRAADCVAAYAARVSA